MFASKDALFSGAAAGYSINNSVRFRSSATAYLNRTPSSASNLQTWTWSGWIKRGTISTQTSILQAGTNGTNDTGIYFRSDNDSIDFYTRTSSTAQGYITTAPSYRDPSAWYHFVFVFDSTNATAANRMRIYCNGVLQTVTINITLPQNTNGFVSSNVAHYIGELSNGSAYLDGYLAEVNFIDGQALTPSSFGAYDATTGVWQPAQYTSTYGTNGFYLKFASFGTAAALGTDSSGNGNTWTVNNLSITTGTTYDPMLDSPTLTSATVANYAVLNPLVKRWSVASETFSNGNLTVTNAGASNDYALGTTFVSSGQYYWEVTATTVSGSFAIGVDNGQLQNSVSTNTVFYNNDGTKSVAGSGTSYGSTYTSADVIGVALDKNANTVTFYKNNTSQGSISLPVTTVPMGAAISPGSSGGVANINFGQRPFSYTPPSGFVALNAYNLPTPTIANGATVMAATTYTGTGASQTVANTVNTINFKPDLVWVKSRSAATDHKLTDSVRGTTKALISDTTGAETTDTTGLTAFGSTGFTVGADTVYNNNTATYIGWQWQAGQGSSSSNTNGSITSTVSVNATAGFSVVTYTGTGANATVGHGLGAQPQFVIVKDRNDITNWAVNHVSIWSAGTGILYLNLTNGVSADSTFWNSTNPTSSVIYLGTNASVNGSGKQNVAYCWSAVAGYSAFGSYTGNGSTDGPFVYLGFRPRWILFKASSASEEWLIWDTSRDVINVMGNYLQAQSSAAEISSPPRLDMLSNGFKARTAFGPNNSGVTYIYAAFAENPFKYALAR